MRRDAADVDAAGAAVAVEEGVGDGDAGEAVGADGGGANEEKAVVAEEDDAPLAF